MSNTVKIGSTTYQIEWINGIASMIFPGIGQFIAGRVQRGIVLIITFLLFLIMTINYWDKIIRTFEKGNLDDWVATIFLLIILVATWLFAVLTAMFHPVDNHESGHSQWYIAWYHFKKDKRAIGGLICIIFLYVIAILTPHLATHNPNMQENVVETRYQSPSKDHYLGTDKFGRDVYSRLLYGARISLSIGFAAVAISIILGTFVGSVAGYFGGIVDNTLMRLVDMLIAFPRLFLILALIAMSQPSLWLVMIVLGLTGWMGTSRIVRGQVLAVKSESYIDAARALGMSNARIMFRHVLPNVLAPVIVAATLGIGGTILAESFLSYLGLGVQPPTPTWGNIISEGRDNMLNAWWISTFPGIAIVVTVVGYNLVGDGLRDAFDPKLRNR